VTVLFTACGFADNGDVPEGMILMSNDIVDYTAYIPQNWIVITDKNAGYCTAYYSETDRTNISVTAFEAEEDYASIDEFWASYEEDFNATFGELSDLTSEQIVLGGYGANRYVFNATVTGIEYKYMQVVCIKGLTVYILTYTAPSASYDTHLADAESVITTFKFD
jgi:hypothetical protein